MSSEMVGMISFAGARVLRVLGHRRGCRAVREVALGPLGSYVSLLLLIRAVDAWDLRGSKEQLSYHGIESKVCLLNQLNRTDFTLIYLNL